MIDETKLRELIAQWKYDAGDLADSGYKRALLHCVATASRLLPETHE